MIIPAARTIATGAWCGWVEPPVASSATVPLTTTFRQTFAQQHPLIAVAGHPGDLARGGAISASRGGGHPGWTKGRARLRVPPRSTTIWLVFAFRRKYRSPARDREAASVSEAPYGQLSLLPYSWRMHEPSRPFGRPLAIGPEGQADGRWPNESAAMVRPGTIFIAGPVRAVSMLCDEPMAADIAITSRLGSQLHPRPCPALRRRIAGTPPAAANHVALCSALRMISG